MNNCKTAQGMSAAFEAFTLLNILDIGAALSYLVLLFPILESSQDDALWRYKCGRWAKLAKQVFLAALLGSQLAARAVLVLVEQDRLFRALSVVSTLLSLRLTLSSGAFLTFHWTETALLYLTNVLFSLPWADRAWKANVTGSGFVAALAGTLPIIPLLQLWPFFFYSTSLEREPVDSINYPVALLPPDIFAAARQAYEESLLEAGQVLEGFFTIFLWFLPWRWW